MALRAEILKNLVSKVGTKAERFTQSVLPGMEHLAPLRRIPEEARDLATQARYARRDANRTNSSWVSDARMGKENTRPNPYHVWKYPIHDYHGDTFWPSPFEANLFHKYGTYEELPIRSLHSMQEGVAATRVEEIVADPKTAINPRLPHERPLVMRIGDSQTPQADIIWQGNHRASAAYDQNQMFLNAQVFDPKNADWEGIVSTRQRQNAAYARGQELKLDKDAAVQNKRRELAMQLMQEHQASSVPPPRWSPPPSSGRRVVEDRSGAFLNSGVSSARQGLPRRARGFTW